MADCIAEYSMKGCYLLRSTHSAATTYYIRIIVQYITPRCVRFLLKYMTYYGYPKRMLMFFNLSLAADNLFNLLLSQKRQQRVPISIPLRATVGAFKEIYRGAAQ